MLKGFLNCFLMERL